MALLIQARADVARCDMRGNTPLHVVGGNSKIKENRLYWCNDQVGDCLALLLEAKAPVDARNAKQRPPIYYALGRHNLSQVKKLVEAKAVVSRHVIKWSMDATYKAPEHLRPQPFAVLEYLKLRFTPQSKLPALVEQYMKKLEGQGTVVSLPATKDKGVIKQQNQSCVIL